MLYTLMMEDSSDEASARPRRKPKGGRSRDWLVREERVTHSGAWGRFRGFRSPVETLASADDRRRGR